MALFLHSFPTIPADQVFFASSLSIAWPFGLFVTCASVLFSCGFRLSFAQVSLGFCLDFAAFMWISFGFQLDFVKSNY